MSPAPDPHYLAKRYLEGLTLRELGADVGRLHSTVRFHLRKLPNYRRMVTTMLLQRLRTAQERYSITRNPQNRRRLKHALAMLRQKRPAEFRRWLKRQGPPLPNAVQFGGEYRADCTACSTARSVFARKEPKRWIWRCYECGASGEARRRR